MRVLVTGGAGFIGSALIRYSLQGKSHSILNLDKLSYAANLKSLSEVDKNPDYQFTQCDICDESGVEKVFRDFKPEAVVHLAGETHVDRSISHPEAFVQANVVGTQVLLECAKRHWEKHSDEHFRFLFVSTDEVYGSREDASNVNEEAVFQPNSPYAGSKAAATHLVNTYYRTYGLPIIVSYSSNNYGPWQYPEKLIPKTVQNALSGKPIPVYGSGENIRDWLYVDDHVRALSMLVLKGQEGRSYNIAADNEISNIELVNSICLMLDKLKPLDQGSYCDQITFVEDRQGHDKRYGIDAGRIKREIGWIPTETFSDGLHKTVLWNVDNLEL